MSKNNKIEKFNASFPIGTEVIFKNLIGDSNRVITKVKSKAFLLSGHTPVVFLDNIQGCVSIEHVFKHE